MKIFNPLLLGLVLALASRGATAQETLSGPLTGDGGDLPPAVDLSNDYGGETLPSVVDEGDSPLEPIAAGEETEGFDGSILGQPMHLLEQCTPYFESSGTWLQRGFWFTELDYVAFNRSWERKGLILANEERVVTTNPIGQYIVQNVLQIGGSRPGMEGVGRVKLGRFLFRDVSNRDHLLEATWLGGGSWQQAVSLDAATTNGLQVSNFIDRVNESFDGARSMNYVYDSEMNSGELNYTVRTRMSRDQLQLQPNGTWVRAANPTKTYSYLAGLRYIDVSEELDWNATEIPVTNVLNESGFYTIDTENRLLGTQMGGSFGYETARWSITATAKAGGYWNRMHLKSAFQVGETTIVNSGETDSTEDNLSFVGEAGLLTKWHLRPNVSLRAGLDLLYIESVALAPFQANFIPGGYSAIASGGDCVYMGGSVGIESYW
ncbi:BBP7 family outer membrane beta-barrel protein [Lacipirellula limnantheis]|uniref:Alginate export domain-containing protein n=1 Tax=Lacipirellula limnantheis TaxID=2528024 RepID=A0A517TU79_9BACT|nr:BBP7 family outer membrane beta-barrel protein [Lacipirellula limnantheis]QDT71926.1 hypothetical protein I41_10880 [Lacipirellula limnantheis]